MNKHLTITFALAALAFGVASTLVVQRVRASGVPVKGALTYTGALANPDGTPVTAPSKQIGLFTYDAQTAGTIVQDCTVLSSTVSLTEGQFQIQLPDACSAQMKATPDLWLEVQVDGASLGRTKLGAVPYAVKAAHAVSADLATNATTAIAASGTLDTRIGAIESRVTAIEAASPNKSAFKAHLTRATSIPSGPYTPVAFDMQEFDFGAEYDPTTGIFSPKSAGYYYVSCTLLWAQFSSTGSGPYLSARVSLNGGWAGEDVDASTGTYPARSTQTLLQLAANDQVRCEGRQMYGADLALYVEVPTENRFEAFRVTP